MTPVCARVHSKSGPRNSSSACHWINWECLILHSNFSYQPLRLLRHIRTQTLPCHPPLCLTMFWRCPCDFRFLFIIFRNKSIKSMKCQFCHFRFQLSNRLRKRTECQYAMSIWYTDYSVCGWMCKANYWQYYSPSIDDMHFHKGKMIYHFYSYYCAFLNKSIIHCSPDAW